MTKIEKIINADQEKKRKQKNMESYNMLYIHTYSLLGFVFSICNEENMINTKVTALHFIVKLGESMNCIVYSLSSWDLILS